jgi:Zn-dependent protease with chaperone function
MNTLEGHYFDGRTSRQRPATLTFYRDGGVRLSADEEVRTFVFTDLEVTARVANTPRGIVFPDGSKFETVDNDGVDEILGHFGTAHGSRWLHLLETRLRFILVALVVVAVSVWGFVQYGIPALARAAAFALPASTSASIGRGSLEILDRSYLGASELDEAEKERIRGLFRDVVRGLSEPFEFILVFREGRSLGANALALPAGTVIMTDELVALAGDDAEVVAVLAHEVGHVIHRHALRQAIQNSMVAVLVILVTGDLSSTSTLVAAVPALVVEAQFSQAFELEADDHALEHLRREGIDPVHFANLMRRLDRSDSEGSILSYFSSHPPTPERIRRFETAPAPR